jgi:hypothetical protein
MAKRKTKQKEVKIPQINYYLLNEQDLECIDSLISTLGLATSQILECRKIRERPENEMDALEDFHAQVDIVMQETEQQMQFPWGRGKGF